MSHVYQLRVIGIIGNFVLKMYAPEGDGFFVVYLFQLSDN